MQIGIIGLPNTGKSTIFNVLAKGSAAVANYPFCTIEPNTGFVSVPDPELEGLSGIYNSAKTTQAAINFVDVAGLVKGASAGEGLGNRFLSHIREVDAVAHVVRCFHDDNVPHSLSRIDPIEDIDIIKTELILADIETLNRKREKVLPSARSGDSYSRKSIEIIDYLISELNSGKIPDAGSIYDKNTQLFSELNLLILKPAIYVANCSEGSQSVSLFKRLSEKINPENIFRIFGKIESELLDFDDEEKKLYRKELGIESGGPGDFIKKCYKLLDLITFYTINQNEARAWPLKRLSRASEAAGKIHSDMQKGFIKAEVINCRELLKAGSIIKAKEEGKLRIEGRDYIVQDMDVIQIRFSAN